jgi:hypothetical protein
MTEIDRRSIMLGALALGMSVCAPIAAHTLALDPKNGRYSIGNSELSVEWGWDKKGVWEMSSREGVCWYNDGAVDDPRMKWSATAARELIIEHFGLKDVADQFPLEVIAHMPPFRLFAIRRYMEQKLDLPKIDMISDRGGAHCCASTIA